MTQAPPPTHTATHTTQLVREPAPASLPPSPADLREQRHMLAITAATGLTFGVALFILTELFGGWMRANFAGAVRVECSDDRPCAAGECSAGQCITIDSASAPACGPGDPCSGGCECLAPLSCLGGLCVPPPVAPAVCDDPDIQRLLADISRKCAGDFFGCPETDLQKFVLESETFDDLLTKFPDTITVHFDEKQPKSTKPLPQIEAHYLERLGAARNRSAIEQATMLLLVARSSPGTHKSKSALEASLTVSRRRNREVTRLLKQLGDSPAATSAINKKIRPLNLGEKKPLTADLYNKLPRNSRITWSKRADAELGKGIRYYKKLKPDQKRWVFQTLNQVVFIVPITCDLPTPEASP
jgi:hypothetical protein